MKDFTKEIKDILSELKKTDIIYGKSLDYILSRNKAKQEEFEETLLNCKFLEFTAKQEHKNETRYVLYFRFSNKQGRVYVIIPKEKLKIITNYPLGKKTLRKYRKRRFIKSEDI